MTETPRDRQDGGQRSNRGTDEAVDTEETREQIQKHGHKWILSSDCASKMESVTTVNAAYVPPKAPGVRVRGIRDELMEKHIAQTMRKKVQAEKKLSIPKIDFSSTTQRDFCAQGFVPLKPESTQVHDYKTEQAITFWSENYQCIQGVTRAHNPKMPFRKSALFSTPISDVLDEDQPPADE